MNQNPKNSIFKSYGLFWKNYFNFTGRARRSDYWNTFIINILIEIVLVAINYAVVGSGDQDYTEMLKNIDSQSVVPGTIILITLGLIALYGVATIIPNISITVRRLHDVGKIGWLVFIGLIPVVGKIVLLFICCMDSEKTSNKYGLSDKYVV